MDALSIEGPEGGYLLRTNLVFAAFRRCRHVEIAGRIRGAAERALNWMPLEQLKWGLVGVNSTKYRKTNSNVLARCLEECGSVEPMDCNRYFDLCGPEISGPDYRIMVCGYAAPKKAAFADETNLIELVFPLNYLDQRGSEVFIKDAASIFEALEADSAYAGPALCYGTQYDESDIAKKIAPLALQHPGFDVPDNDSTSVVLGGARCRGARWLTFLSHRLLARLGSIDQVRSQLASGVLVQELSNGLMICAGLRPEIGQVNRGEGTPLLASVAHAIEPITYFGDNSLLPLFGDDEDKRDRWERRFWR